MTEKRRSLFEKATLVAALALAACVALGVGTASARYMSDGAVPEPVNGGWTLPTDFVCVKGVHLDGTLDLAAGVTSRRDCIYYTTGLTGMAPIDVTATSTCGSAGTLPCNVEANCTGSNPVALGTLTWNSTDLKCYNSAPCTVQGYAGNDGAKHGLATSICVDGSGNGISLKDLDRTAQMCVAKSGTWKQTTSPAPYGVAGTFPTPGFGGACVAYGAQFKGQDADGTPLTFGTRGTDAADAGFCYATMNMTTAYPTSALCPSSSTNSSTANFWAWASSKCTYSRGIEGYLNSALTKADGTTTAAGTFVDLSLITTMGDCTAFGASWNNWQGVAGSTASVPTTPPGFESTIPVWDYQTQTPDADEGCLHCHSSTVQYNGPREREKDSYLKTGHKNMLRKVTAGENWAGPVDGVLEVYTAAASGQTLNFAAATASGSYGADKPLLYLFGDWMAPAPDGLDTVVNIGGFGKYNGTSNYSCAPCHSTGWSNSTAGLCSLSSYTTSGTCTGAGGTWYTLIGVEGIGTTGFAPQEPAASFPGITFTSAGKWDLNGIQCGRCHNATVPIVTPTQIAASQFPQTTDTKGGMGNVPGGPPGTWVTKLCFSCHQSIAKTLNGTGPDADLTHAADWIPVKNTATSPSYIPEFSGHVLGGSFMNSPHGKATGATIVPNPLGKYDIATATYTSAFKGYTCWQSSTGTSPAMTRYVAGEVHEIETKAECEALYGPGTWRADTQGSCATCHDVHNSLFVAEQEERAFRKECTDCHENADYAAAIPAAAQIDLTKINHLGGVDTPMENMATKPNEACEICHMPKATSSGFPMHLWRINTSDSYSTFPTSAEFLGNVKKIANTAADGTYTNAVWVDVDLACGQCHGASGPGPEYTKAYLATVAEGMHADAGVNYPVTFSYSVAPNTLNVTVTASVDCGAGGCPVFTYDWNWGEVPAVPNGSGNPATHTYPTAGAKSITLTVNLSGLSVGSHTRSFTIAAPDLPPTAAGVCTWNADTWVMSVTDTSSDDGPDGDTTPPDGNATLQIVMDWGDGTTKSFGSQGVTLNHTYNVTGGFLVSKKAIDSKLQSASMLCAAAATPSYFTISGTVKNKLPGTKNLASATVQVRRNGTLVKTVYTATNGTFSATNLKPGAYTLTVAKSGYTFAVPALTIPAVGPSSAGNTIYATGP